MNTSNQRLDYSTVRAQYQEKFGDKPPGALLKSVSLMDGGTQDLARAMESAVKSGEPLDFNNFAREFFNHLAGQQKAPPLISLELEEA